MNRSAETARLCRDMTLIAVVWIVLFGGFAILYGAKSALGFDIVPGVDMLNDDLLRFLSW